MRRHVITAGQFNVLRCDAAGPTRRVASIDQAVVGAMDAGAFALEPKVRRFDDELF
jgi:hypothetical protein